MPFDKADKSSISSNFIFTSQTVKSEKTTIMTPVGPCHTIYELEREGPSFPADSANSAITRTSCNVTEHDKSLIIKCTK